jgi:hypothetical protein
MSTGLIFKITPQKGGERMKRQVLFDAFLDVCEGDYKVGMYYIPVSVGGEFGILDVVEIPNNLVAHGEITPETYFGVSFDDGDDSWEKLINIKIEGNPALYLKKRLNYD